MRNEEREKESLPGGALDAAGTSERGYFMRGERMSEANYVCMYDLLSFIPSLDDPAKTIKQDTLEATAAYPWNNKARLVANTKILNFTGHIDESKQEAGKNGMTCSPRIAHE
jgi:myosin-crossreactive antigen